MREIAHHILDLVQNSITAKATLINLKIIEDLRANRLSVYLADNGVGMSPEILARVTDPFYTTRTTRSVGLGIPMFKANAELCNGGMTIQSELGIGTSFDIDFDYDHIDRPPLGDMANTIVGIVLSLESGCDLVYEHTYNHNTFTLDTREMRQMLGEDADLCAVEVLQWLQGYVAESLSEIVSVGL